MIITAAGGRGVKEFGKGPCTPIDENNDNDSLLFDPSCSDVRHCQGYSRVGLSESVHCDPSQTRPILNNDSFLYCEQSHFDLSGCPHVAPDAPRVQHSCNGDANFFSPLIVAVMHIAPVPNGPGA